MTLMQYIANIADISFNKLYYMRYLLLCLLLLPSFLLLAQKKVKQEYYLVKVYHCVNQIQIDHVEEHVGKQVVPFLKKHKVPTVGVFLPIANDTAVDKKLMVWVPLSNLEQLGTIENAFGAIDPFGADPLIHLDSFQNNSPFTRIESMLASAFKLHPQHSRKRTFQKSPDNIFEFRSYESSTEDLHLRKVHMFNEGGEIDLFNRLNFNAVFYGRVVVGARVPNLIYMTSFKDMADRNQHWNTFRDDPQWKQLSPMPKYASTVSRNETILMKPSKYSEL
jgi:hypothetical protein